MPRQSRSRARRGRPRKGASAKSNKIKLYKYVPIALRPHHFMRQTISSLALPGTWSAYNGIGGTASGYLATNLTFKLSDIPGYTEFTALFERYRLDKIVVEVQVPQTIAGGDFDTSGTSIDVAQMKLVTLPSTDTNRVSVAKNLDDVLQMNKPQHRDLIGVKDNKVSTVIKPNILFQTYETAVATGYTEKYSPWLYVEEPDHIHYGLSLGVYRVDGSIMAGPGNVPLPKFMLTTKYYFTMKTVN